MSGYPIEGAKRVMEGRAKSTIRYYTQAYRYEWQADDRTEGSARRICFEGEEICTDEESESGMFFKKPKRDTLSEVFGNGGMPATGDGDASGADADPRDIDPLELLRSKGINTDLIPDSLLPTIASSMNMETNDASEIARIKVECNTCNRPVAYGRGKCMYCGKPLELPESLRADAASPGGTAAGETGLDFDLGDSL